MDNSIDAIFKWKNSVKKSVEKTHEKDKYVSSWDKIDVMYSFIGIYQIGIYAFYPEKCKRTDYVIRCKETNKYFSLKYLTELHNDESRYRAFSELNKVIEESGLIEIIDSVGNVIPVWPGGNTDRGTRAYCFDIPDIYFCYMYRRQ